LPHAAREEARQERRFFGVALLDTPEVIRRKQRDRTQHLIGQIVISGTVASDLGISPDDVILAVGDTGAWHALTDDQVRRWITLRQGQ